MKVLLIGATGATGQEILPLLMEAGHKVTALVRNPAGLTTRNEFLTVIEGDVRNQEAVEKAIEGQDAVLVAFGPRSLEKSDIQETLMKNTIAGMKKHGVKRIINLSAWGAGSTARRVNPIFRLFRMTLLKNVFDDKDRGQKLLTESGLDYVNVCPGRLVNKSARGHVKASVDGKGIKGEMTRADLAKWMVDQTVSGTWVRKDPIIGY